jgi:hypothetical protein
MARGEELQAIGLVARHQYETPEVNKMKRNMELDVDKWEVKFPL